ncbi:MAG: hypothetical protein Q8O89_04715 [Nanoarchaeota archaeon]|nr:hypothetical protein [Nanoarchaeota archaeon]
MDDKAIQDLEKLLKAGGNKWLSISEAEEIVNAPGSSFYIDNKLLQSWARRAWIIVKKVVPDEKGPAVWRISSESVYDLLQQQKKAAKGTWVPRNEAAMRLGKKDGALEAKVRRATIGEDNVLRFFGKGRMYLSEEYVLAEEAKLLNSGASVADLSSMLGFERRDGLAKYIRDNKESYNIREDSKGRIALSIKESLDLLENRFGLSSVYGFSKEDYYSILWKSKDHKPIAALYKLINNMKDKKEQMLKSLFTVSDVADILGITESTLFRHHSKKIVEATIFPPQTNLYFSIDQLTQAYDKTYGRQVKKARFSVTNEYDSADAGKKIFHPAYGIIGEILSVDQTACMMEVKFSGMKKKRLVYGLNK